MWHEDTREMENGRIAHTKPQNLLKLFVHSPWWNLNGLLMRHSYSVSAKAREKWRLKGWKSRERKLFKSWSDGPLKKSRSEENLKL